MTATRKGKLPPKGNVLSVRVSDHELENVAAIMASTRKRRSDVLKEAFTLYIEEHAAPGRNSANSTETGS